jgi:hypothetical protein
MLHPLSDDCLVETAAWSQRIRMDQLPRHRNGLDTRAEPFRYPGVWTWQLAIAIIKSDELG